jgi:signal transduction histidine kinase
MGPDPEPARRPEYQRATFACSRYERSVPRHVLACGELGDQSYRRAVEPFRHHFGGVAAAHGAGVSASLRDTLEALHAEIEDRKLHRRQPGEATRRPIIRNATQLQPLSLNLCLNAIQAMDQGGGRTVRVADLSERDGSTLLVEVADTGPGIADVLLPTIFDPFVTTKPHGTGLGLAICRGIADAHHARVSARNNVGRPGCTFTVESPVPSGRPARHAP